MHQAMKRVLMMALVSLASTVPAWGVAQADVTVALTAHRVIQNSGRETLEPGNQAFPGEVLEYRASYRNGGAASRQGARARSPARGRGCEA